MPRLRPWQAPRRPPPNAELPAQWGLLGRLDTKGGTDAYVERSTIRRSGAAAQISDLMDFKNAQVFQGKPFLSVRSSSSTTAS